MILPEKKHQEKKIQTDLVGKYVESTINKGENTKKSVNQKGEKFLESPLH